MCAYLANVCPSCVFTCKPLVAQSSAGHLSPYASQQADGFIDADIDIRTDLGRAHIKHHLGFKQATVEQFYVRRVDNRCQVN